MLRLPCFYLFGQILLSNYVIKGYALQKKENRGSIELSALAELQAQSRKDY